MRNVLLFLGLLGSGASAQTLYTPPAPVVVVPVVVSQPGAYVSPPSAGGFIYTVMPARPVVVPPVRSGGACAVPRPRR